MKRLITETFAERALIIILSLVIIFHALIMLGIIPYEIAWGGRLTDKSQMLSFETISILINLVMLLVVAIKARLLKIRVNKLVVKGALWVMFGLFLFNTIGNYFSTNAFEKAVFTPMTLMLMVFSFRLAISKPENAK